MSVTIGMKGSAEALVCESNTAQAAGSGTLPVFATPVDVCFDGTGILDRRGPRTRGGGEYRRN